MKTIHTALIASLALLSTFTLSGCSDDDNTKNNISPSPTISETLTPEEQKMVNEYIAPTTNPKGKIIEAKDPLVELLSN